MPSTNNFLPLLPLFRTLEATHPGLEDEIVNSLVDCLVDNLRARMIRIIRTIGIIRMIRMTCHVVGTHFGTILEAEVAEPEHK